MLQHEAGIQITTSNLRCAAPSFIKTPETIHTLLKAIGTDNVAGAVAAEADDLLAIVRAVLSPQDVVQFPDGKKLS